ncbi:hypothetical protein AMJ44_05245 [candidate division WOR-1 bacterium DG_54_3]|uniref:DUF4412 domain-containing protein n=1 Tax=candidate division WOR-1 bacterium DG_54_3 TaxID=1703775 RepID=A0A0S7Y3C5_UNCSA|nr:MAG: hypothetical protein AMJ44_05245 [candidate division WOR-1 bacterium DG_54_3]
MFRKIVGLFVLSVFVLSVSALALDFSADSVNVQMVGKEKEVTRGKAYVTKDKLRAEGEDEEGEKSIIIFRYDKKVLWILIPEEKKYMEQKLSTEQLIAAMAEIEKELKQKVKTEFKVEKKLLGTEKISGILCNKYKITTKIIEDGKTKWEYTIYQWISTKYKDLIMKTEEEDGSYNYLKNVKFAKQPAYLFERPKGYAKIEMGVIRFGEEAEEEEEVEKEEERVEEEIKEEFKEELKEELMPELPIKLF